MTGPTSWASPDPARGPGAPPVAPASEPAFAPVPDVAAEETGPPVRDDVRAGALAALASVLVAAPVGLLWAAMSPKVSVVLAGSSVTLATPDNSAFIAGDGYFLGIVFVVGLVVGALGWWVAGRQHGPGVVLGLTAGGLLAAYVAARTGALVEEATAREAVLAGRSGVVDLAVRLRASEAMLAWPVGALIGFLGPALLRGE